MDKLVWDNTDCLINHYNTKMNTKINGDKNLRKNIINVLKEWSVDDCLLVIDYICSDEWHIKNNFATLSVIFRPTKFMEKWERARLAQQDNMLVEDPKTGIKYFGGMELL